mgnify:CR=1 FL=1
MVIWEPPIDDYEFLLHEIFDVVPSLKKLGFMTDVQANEMMKKLNKQRLDAATYNIIY